MTRLHDAFVRTLEKENLTEEEAYEAMLDLIGGEVAPELASGFLVALRTKGETPTEITGFARAMRERANRIAPRVQGRLIDTCGTGGSSVKAFNVSTAAAFVAAAAGAPVAKHGNRSTTRPSGSADVLEALGVNLNLAPERVRQIIEDIGIGFLFAPAFHPAMKHAVAPRKALGVRTVFNLLGPLTNPAGAQGHLLGVFDAELTRVFAEVLHNLGIDRALVVHGEGLDEATLSGPTQYTELKDGLVTGGAFTPEDLGLTTRDAKEYAPMSPEDSAAEIRRILGAGGGARSEFTALNAGLAIYVAGLAETMADGVDKAKEVLASGEALKLLDRYVAATQEGEAP